MNQLKKNLKRKEDYILKSILGRLMTLVGAAGVIYCLFIPVVLMEFEMSPVELGSFSLKNQTMQVEASLYNIGDRLASPDESDVQIPEVINYLWIMFLGLSAINILLALKPHFPKLLRMLFGLMPLALLVIVVYQTGSNPELNIGFSGLFSFFTSGFYFLAAGTLVLLFGTILTGKKRAIT